MSDQGPDERIDADLRAFRSATARDLPTLDATASAVRRSLPSSNRKRSFTLGDLKKRPALATLAGATALAIASIFVPVSWERTVGHDVTLELAGQPSESRIQEVVGDLRQSLAADGVKVTVRDGVCRLEAATSDASRGRVDAAMIQLGNELAQKGLRTSVRVEPRVEMTSGSVWAFAGERVVELTIQRAGRSAGEIESDIRQQLQSAGFANADVSVELADERTEIRIDCGTAGAEGEPKEQIQLQLRREGGGDDPIEVSLPQFERPAGMSDDEFRNHIVAELRARGVDNPEVTVNGDQVEIRAERRIER
ncbi:MAG: hypothetical protein ACRDGR_04190 [bacterium]